MSTQTPTLPGTNAFDHLPRRPWLRRDVPLLWRTDTCLQVGLDPQRRVMLEVDRPLIEWARTLTGARTLEVAIAEAQQQGLAVDEALHLLQLLISAGALDDAARIPRCVSDLSTHERDTATRHQACARQTYVDERAYAAVDARAEAVIVVLGRQPLAEKIINTLRASGFRHVFTTDPEPSGNRKHRGRNTEPALRILADAWHPDAIGVSTVSDGRHESAVLPVAVWGRHGHVGPLVLPGQSSCLRCWTLHRCDEDPAWPRLSVQLTHQKPDVDAIDAALLQAVSAHVAMLASAFVEAQAVGDSGVRFSGVTQGIELPGGAVTTRAHEVHPLCGCSWRN